MDKKQEQQILDYYSSIDKYIPQQDTLQCASDRIY